LKGPGNTQNAMDTIPPIIKTIKRAFPELSHTRKVELYENTAPLLQKAIETGMHEDILKHAYTCICCLEDRILATTLSEVFKKIMPEAVKAMMGNEKWQDAALRLLKKQHPDLDANSDIEGQTEFTGEVPCISDFGDYCSFAGHAAPLKDLKDIVEYYNDLSRHKNAVDDMEEVLKAGLEIRKFLGKNPGFIQAELRDEVKIDPIVINKLCQKMEKYKILKREKDGASFKLTLLK